MCLQSSLYFQSRLSSNSCFFRFYYSLFLINFSLLIFDSQSYSYFAKSFQTHFQVFSIVFKIILSFEICFTLFTILSSLQFTAPTYIQGDLFKFLAGVYTISILDFLLPSIEFSFVSWRTKSNSCQSNLSHVQPSLRRRQTWAEDKSAAWNHTSIGKLYLISSQFSYLSFPLYTRCPSGVQYQNTILILQGSIRQMNVTQLNPASYKKTSMKLSDMSPRAPKMDLLKIQKKLQGIQTPPLAHSQNSYNQNSVISNLNSIPSTSSLSAVSLCATQDLIRRIAKQEASSFYQETIKNNNKIQNSIQKIQSEVQSLWKATRIALQETTYQIHKQTSQQFDLMLGGMKKAMIQIQKQIKNQLMHEVKMYSPLNINGFKDISEEVYRISQHVFRAPYERQKPNHIQSQVKMISQQILAVHQSNQNICDELNKIKTTINTLTSIKKLQSPDLTSSIVQKVVRPQSASSANLQFGRSPNSKRLKSPSFKRQHKYTQSTETNKLTQLISFQNIPAPSCKNQKLQSPVKGYNQGSQGPLLYQVDSQGRLQDSHGIYLLDENGQIVLMQKQQMDALRRFNMLIQ